MGRVMKGGGCQCGRVRYCAGVDPAEEHLCHCRMCQRTTELPELVDRWVAAIGEVPQ